MMKLTSVAPLMYSAWPLMSEGCCSLLCEDMIGTDEVDVCVCAW